MSQVEGLPALTERRYSTSPLPLEKLNRALVLLRRFECFEGAEVASFPGPGIFFARVEAILAGLEFANHPGSIILQKNGCRNYVLSTPFISRTEGECLGARAASGPTEAQQRNWCSGCDKTVQGLLLSTGQQFLELRQEPIPFGRQLVFRSSKRNRGITDICRVG